MFTANLLAFDRLIDCPTMSSHNPQSRPKGVSSTALQTLHDPTVVKHRVNGGELLSGGSEQAAHIGDSNKASTPSYALDRWQQQSSKEEPWSQYSLTQPSQPHHNL